MAPRSDLVRTQSVLDEPSSPMMSSRTASRPLKFLKGEKKKKQVHFLTPGAEEISVDIHWVPALADLTLEEKESTWLTRQDLQQMDETLRLDLMRSSLRHHQTELGENPLRGLEWKTFDGVRERNNNRKKGLRAVMDEQNRQRYSDDRKVLDSSIIARTYHQAVESCQLRAREVAVQDEQIASQIIREDFGDTE